MDVTEGPTKPTKLQIAVTPVLLDLQHPHKPSSVLAAPAFTSDSEGKAVWFTDATAKHTIGNQSTEQLLSTLKQE